MMVSCDAVYQEEAQLREANTLVCAQRHPLRFQALANSIRIVAV